MGIDEVRRTVVEEMASEGWSLTDAENPDSIVELGARGDWVFVHEVRERDRLPFPIPWARRLAVRFARTSVGVSGRSWSNDGDIELARFDGVRCVGALRVRHDDEVPVEAPFLVDLAPAKNRAKLARGVAAESCGEVFETLLALAGLPAPVWRHQAGMGDVVLGFSEHLRPGSTDAASELRHREVFFTTSFHVRGVSPDEVIDAITKACARSRLRLVNESKHPNRRIFVTKQQAWVSFGEVVDRGRPRDWGATVSKALDRPALTVCWDDEKTSIHTSLGGKVVGSATASRRSRQALLVDEEVLVPFGGDLMVVPIETGLLSNSLDHLGAITVVTKALGLAKPVIEGNLKGRLLTFE